MFKSTIDTIKEELLDVDLWMSEYDCLTTETMRTGIRKSNIEVTTI
ncbi:MAG: hypothetical protein LBI79_09665 [Nitrososphaerota archaeon]|nr:hypothetical protein [Nitrososphaerota archaeon]